MDAAASLKELHIALTVPYIGWDKFSIMEDNLAIILLSQTTSTGSRRHPRTELVFLISFSSLLLSAIEYG